MYIFFYVNICIINYFSYFFPCSFEFEDLNVIYKALFSNVDLNKK